MDDSSTSPAPKIFKYMAKRPKTGLQAVNTLQESLQRTQSDHTPVGDTQIKLQKFPSRPSTNSSKLSYTRPSTAIHSAKSERPKSMFGYRGLKIDILSPAGSPKSALHSPKSAFGSPRSPLSANVKMKLNTTEMNGYATPFPIFSAKSARSTLHTMMSFYENTSESHLKLLQRSEDIIQDNVRPQQKTSKPVLKHRRTISLQEKKAKEQIKVKAMEECILPGKEGPDSQIPTVKNFLNSVKGNMDYCKRRDVQDILKYTSSHHNIKEHLLKLGLASPRSFREKEMFQSFDREVDACLFNNTQRMRDDIMGKNWAVCPRKIKTRKPLNKEPLIFSQAFNMKKYCKSRGLSSITEALRFHNDKAWNVALNEPHRIQNYIEVGDRNNDEMSQSSSDSD